MTTAASPTRNAAKHATYSQSRSHPQSQSHSPIQSQSTSPSPSPSPSHYSTIVNAGDAIFSSPAMSMGLGLGLTSLSSSLNSSPERLDRRSPSAGLAHTAFGPSLFSSPLTSGYDSPYSSAAPRNDEDTESLNWTLDLLGLDSDVHGSSSPPQRVRPLNPAVAGIIGSPNYRNRSTTAPSRTNIFGPVAPRSYTDVACPRPDLSRPRAATDLSAANSLAFQLGLVDPHPSASRTFASATLSSAVVASTDSGELTLAEIEKADDDLYERHRISPSRSVPLDRSAATPSPPPSLTQSQQASPARSESPMMDCGGLGVTFQTPTRSLWIGNIDPALSPGDLLAFFSPFGSIESLRVLPDKECAFINYVNLQDAIKAKNDMQGGRVGNCIVKVGFGKVESIGETQGTQPTKSLWIGNLWPGATIDELKSYFEVFGRIETARVLGGKNCGFVNFDRLQDAMNARKDLNGKEVNGHVVRIGFAKVPNKEKDTTSSSTGEMKSEREIRQRTLSHSSGTSASAPSIGSPVRSPQIRHSEPRLAPSSPVHDNGFTQAAKNVGSPQHPLGHPFTPSPLARFQSTPEPKNVSADQRLPSRPPHFPSKDSPDSSLAQQSAWNSNAENTALANAGVSNNYAEEPLAGDLYASAIQALPDPSPSRRVDQARLRDMRKRLEGHCTLKDIEAMYWDCVEESVDLSTDYIGNVVLQKIVERTNDTSRLRITEKVAPHMAAIGIHKNGTWVVQKIIDCAKTTHQISIITAALKPFTPPLLLDQFGNYVVQCCLRLGTHRNQFVFDAMHTKCLDIATGRFGARAMRACLESQYTTKRQQKHVAIAVVQNAVALCTNPNGAILITWLLDTSSLPGRYRVIAPKLASHIIELSTHKLASATVLKLVTQRIEMDARELVLQNIFYRPDNTLAAILGDQVHGVSMIQKILASACVNSEEKVKLADRVRSVLGMMPEVKDHIVGYKRLLDELSSIPSASSTGSRVGQGQVSIDTNEDAADTQDWDSREDVVSPLTLSTNTSTNHHYSEENIVSHNGQYAMPSASNAPIQNMNGGGLAHGQGQLYGWGPSAINHMGMINNAPSGIPLAGQNLSHYNQFDHNHALMETVNPYGMQSYPTLGSVGFGSSLLHGNPNNGPPGLAYPYVNNPAQFNGHANMMAPQGSPQRDVNPTFASVLHQSDDHSPYSELH